jgi:hypothetical protein
VLLSILLCACGRVGFSTADAGVDASAEAGADASDASDAAMIDVPAGPPPAFVQQAIEPTGGGQQIKSASFAQDVTMGNLLIAHLDTYTTGSPGIALVTDTQGNTFTVLPPMAGATYKQFVAWTYANATGPDTITVTMDAAPNAYLEMRIKEYTGVDTTAPIDALVHCEGTAVGTDAEACTATTTSPSMLLLGIALDGNVAAGTGFTAQDNAFSDVAEELAAPTPGAYTLTATPENQWDFLVIPIRPGP